MSVITKKAVTLAVLGAVGLAGLAIGSGALAGGKHRHGAPRMEWSLPAEAQNAKTLSLSELEERVRARGLQVKELKVKGLVLEVEGLAADGFEHKLMLDRRSGEVLAQKQDD